MSTQYIYKTVFICPEALQAKANQLACIMGSTTEDIHTFDFLNYADVETQVKYAVVGTVTRQEFIDKQFEGLPNPLPAHAAGCNVEEAQEVLDGLNTANGLQFFINESIENCTASMEIIPIGDLPPEVEEI